MKRIFRPSIPKDVPSILALFDQAGLRPNRAPHELHWKYWQSRRELPGARSFVLTHGDDLIAHGGATLGRCVWPGHRINTAHVIDWAALPKAAGAGVALMKHIGQQTDMLLAIGGSAQTLALLPYMGFRPAGVVTGYVRTLFPLRLLRGTPGPVWRLIPRFGRSVAWTLAAPSAADDWRSRRIASEEIDTLASVFPVHARGMAVLERTTELFRYVLSCPIVPMTLFGVERNGRARGYFLLASAPGQVRIADCWIDSEDPAEWRGMLLCAVSEAKKDPRAAEVVAWANDPVLSGALAESGFHVRNQTPIQIRPANDESMPPLPLRVQMLDNDRAFLNEGLNEYWA
jgi:hypothetical protein